MSPVGRPQIPQLLTPPLVRTILGDGLHGRVVRTQDRRLTEAGAVQAPVVMFDLI
jgi:hypothetical protein